MNNTRTLIIIMTLKSYALIAGKYIGLFFIKTHRRLRKTRSLSNNLFVLRGPICNFRITEEVGGIL